MKSLNWDGDQMLQFIIGVIIGILLTLDGLMVIRIALEEREGMRK